MKAMETKKGSIRIQERVKLLAWEDSVLDRPIFVDLVYADEIPDTSALVRRINLGDLVDSVRKANEKLPPRRVVDETVSEEEGEGAEEGKSAALSFEIPPDLLDKRFVFPGLLDRMVKEGIFSRESLSPLKPVLTGQGEGRPFNKLGLLGRAANEERTGTSESPFFYSTLLVLLSHLSEQAYAQLLTDSRVIEACDGLRSLLRAWTANISGSVRHQVQVQRVLASPLAPWALRREPATLSVEEARRQHLGVASNEYGMAMDLVEALDDWFMGAPSVLGDDESAAAALDDRIADVQENCGEASTFKARERKVGKNLGLAADFLAVVAALFRPAWHAFGPGEPGSIGARITQPEFPGLVLNGLAAGAITLVSILAFSLILRLYMKGSSPAWQAFLKLRRGLARHAPLRTAFAKALALLRGRRASARVPPRDWLAKLPEFLGKYRKLKSDEADYRKLARLELPPLDFSSSYQPKELEEMWVENACVCYGDEFATLIIGKAATAAVYFVDVTGSTEISTRRNLSNALHAYGRLLTHVNETGTTPLWRKEAGDGHYYCHPAQEALKRSVMTAQGCDSPKVGVGIGIGLSVGEIYTDVRTGDFLNEVTNRAARLNSRDEAVGGYVAARYAQHPFRVHVKYGRLYNRGVTLDERALNAYGINETEARRVVPPFEWSFPVVAELDGRETVSSVTFFIERMEPDAAVERMKALGGAATFGKALHHADRLLTFEVFCHKGEARLAYHTPLERKELREYLDLRGVGELFFLAREEERTLEVSYSSVALPGGENIDISVKPEKAHLKGIGWTAIAEADIPRVTMLDPVINLPRFIAGL